MGYWSAAPLEGLLAGTLAATATDFVACGLGLDQRWLLESWDGV